MEDYKVVIWFCEDGDVVTQFNYDEKYQELLELYTKSLISGETLELRYCTTLGIDLSRIAIYRGEIPYDETIYRFEDVVIIPDKNARLDFWPQGFCDKTDHILEELLGWVEPKETT